jgi:GNAT superfamily N-acetyltransferase
MYFNDLTLARRLEDAEQASTFEYATTQARLCPEFACADTKIGDGLAVYVGPNSPINRIYGLGMHAPVAEAMLDEAAAFFGARGMPAGVDLCPLADPSLTAALLRRGYAVQRFKNVWWLDLAIPFPDQVTHPHEHLRIEIVTSDQRLQWAQVVSAGFSGASVLQDVDVVIPLANAHKPATTCFMAWVGNAPAGGGALAIHDGVAICFSTATRSAFRRLGVQHALLRARLRHARDQGCDLVAVGTTPGTASQRNVERFGFSLGYTKASVVAPTY